MITFIKIIFLLGFIIFIHEAGHFIVAKINKIRVNEFSIGFGPCLFSKKKGDTIYEIRLIPLGGFVNLEGESEESDRENSFNKASISKRFWIVASGALVNIIFGLILFMIIIGYRYHVVDSGNFSESFQYSLISSGELLKEIFIGIGNLFTGKFTLDDMAGPVGISEMVYKTSGIAEFLYLLSLISISLGVTNLLPIVPLDGGKLLLLIIEAIRKKPLKKETELELTSIGFALLLTFSLLVTANDISKLF